jgi:hypothetical protein
VGIYYEYIHSQTVEKKFSRFFCLIPPPSTSSSTSEFVVMKCTTCSTVFAAKDKSSYITHVRQCTKTASFTIGDQKITIDRNEQGLFLCYCSHPGCPKRGFATISGLKSHMKKVMSIWVGPEGKATKVISVINSHKHAC